MHDTKTLKCADCGFEYYFNPAAAVAALITDDVGRLLVTVRAQEPAKGTWDLPGGFADAGESAEEALRREVKEELGIEIASTKYLHSVPNVYEYKKVSYTTVDLVFLCTVEDGSEAKALDGVESLFFKAPADIDPSRFGLSSMREIVSRYVSGLGQRA
ncbi:MAG: NUDIX domain-containing protein [Candidatus Hydrogenedentota bacterium]|nr:MAG: NUDIX domain-containing protein [Candidatus Hydrogenedentota bacterium]